MQFLSTVLALIPFLTAVLAVPELQIEYLGGNNECSRRTKPGDHIDVHYRGTLTDGTQFDASYDRGSPLSFELGAGRVIKGWDDGLLEMCIGEKRKLTIPPHMAYGDRGVGPIPGGATLIFETEMMNIKGVDKDEL